MKHKPAKIKISIDNLGSRQFKDDYNLKYGYIAGGMYRGVASKEMVVRMGKAGMLAFFGAGGLSNEYIEESIMYLKKELNGKPYGINLVHNPVDYSKEEELVQLFLKHNIRFIEAAAFITVTPALVLYRAKGFSTAKEGMNRIIAKVSRPEIAELFLRPAPEKIVSKLLEQGKITQNEAESVSKNPVASDLCVEADSGGHTDQGNLTTILPVIMKLRDDIVRECSYKKNIPVGAAGGIGTPEAALAAFMLGADFILTGSINQCTAEAGISDAAKDILQSINVQDTAYAPAGDMFEIGAKVQVVKKGVFFPSRANNLYELYRQYESIDDIDENTKKIIEEKYFRKSISEVYQETKEYFLANNPYEIEEAERNGKHKMALIFRWYFGFSTRAALEGYPGEKVNYQIQCGPALGAFNQWVKGSPLENWRNRHADEIGIKILDATVELLKKRLNNILTNPAGHGKQ